MKKVLSMAAVALMIVGISGCHSVSKSKCCGGEGEACCAKTECPAGCTKPCCTKPACPEGCTKPCCAKPAA